MGYLPPGLQVAEDLCPCQGVGGFILVERPPDAFGLNRDDINVDVDSVVKLTYFEAAYSNIRKCHLPDHTKGRTLYTRVCQSYSNIAFKWWC